MLLQSVYQAVVDVLDREGILGLYSGLSSSLLGIAVTNGCVPFCDLGDASAIFLCTEYTITSTKDLAAPS